MVISLSVIKFSERLIKKMKSVEFLIADSKNIESKKIGDLSAKKVGKST